MTHPSHRMHLPVLVLRTADLRGDRASTITALQAATETTPLGNFIFKNAPDLTWAEASEAYRSLAHYGYTCLAPRPYTLMLPSYRDSLLAVQREAAQ